MGSKDNLAEILRKRLGAERVPEWRGEPWPDADVTRKRATREDLQGLRNTIEMARSERPIQEYLAAHPVLLSRLEMSGFEKWVFPQFRLGEEYVVDFAVVDRDSAGYHWRLVELESPTAAVLTRVRREPSKEFGLVWHTSRESTLTWMIRFSAW
jgi:hypothetical protein